MLTGIFRAVVAPAALLLLLLGSACSPHNSFGHTVTQTTLPPELTSIVVTGPTSVVSVGQTVQLTATAKYTDGSTKDVTSKVEWHGGILGFSTSLLIFSVSADGVVKGEHAGTATGFARYSNGGSAWSALDATFSITVVP